MSEIRRFLLLYAKKRGISVVEHKSEEPNVCFYTHLSTPENTVTAVSYESQDSALTMAFLQWSDKSLVFFDS